MPGENSTLDAVLKYTLQSIGNNKGYSLMELLEKKMGKEIDNYIYFFSLRNHATLHDVPVMIDLCLVKEIVNLLL